MSRRSPKPRGSSALPRQKPVVMSAVPVSPSTRSLHLTPAWLGQWIDSSLFSQTMYHPRHHFLQQVHGARENGGMSDLCGNLGGQPGYRVCHCHCLCDHTWGSDYMGVSVLAYNHSAQLDSGLPSRLITCGLQLSCVVTMSCGLQLASKSICTRA